MTNLQFFDFRLAFFAILVYNLGSLGGKIHDHALVAPGLFDP